MLISLGSLKARNSGRKAAVTTATEVRMVEHASSYAWRIAGNESSVGSRSIPALLIRTTSSGDGHKTMRIVRNL